MNTAACKSTISFIDGDKGILRYRGYPIEQLAERSNYTEACDCTQSGLLWYSSLLFQSMCWWWVLL